MRRTRPILLPCLLGAIAASIAIADDPLAEARKQDPTNVLLQKGTWKDEAGREFAAELVSVTQNKLSVARRRGTLLLDGKSMSDPQIAAVKKITGWQSLDKAMDFYRGGPVVIKFDVLTLKSENGKEARWPAFRLILTDPERKALGDLASIRPAAEPRQPAPRTDRSNADSFRSSREAAQDDLQAERKRLLDRKRIVLQSKKEIAKMEKEIREEERYDVPGRSAPNLHRTRTRLQLEERNLAAYEQKVYESEKRISEIEARIAKLQPR